MGRGCTFIPPQVHGHPRSRQFQHCETIFALLILIIRVAVVVIRFCSLFFEPSLQDGTTVLRFGYLLVGGKDVAPWRALGSWLPREFFLAALAIHLSGPRSKSCSTRLVGIIPGVGSIVVFPLGVASIVVFHPIIGSVRVLALIALGCTQAVKDIAR